jgi:N-acetylglutamate synthase-like GNAT family acetyltransferase
MMTRTSHPIPTFTCDNVLLEQLGSADVGELATQLRNENLPCEDLLTDQRSFFSFRSNDGTRIGFSGLEWCDGDALLRSVVVTKGFRGRGCGRIVVSKTLQEASKLGVRRVYLLTTTAATFFSQLGFSEIKREGAPEAIAKTKEFAVLCPSSAVLMMRTLK